MTNDTLPSGHELAALQKTVRAFARERIAPVAEELDREARFPYELIAELGALGLMGVTVPAEYGGGGLGALALAVVLEELARADSSVAITVSAHTTLGTMPIVWFGTAEQRSRFVPDLAAGRRLGAFALTEPGCGSDAAAIQTRATHEGGRWTLTGQKMFITSAGTDITGSCVTLARTGERELTTFVVPADANGYAPGRPLRKIGWRASDTRPLSFEGVVLDDDLRLGPAGDGLRQVMSALAVGRIGIAALAVGLAQTALDLALDHARARRAFGHRLSGHQVVQFQLAEMATEVTAARCLVHHAAGKHDAGEPFAVEAAMAKLVAGRLAQTVAERSLHLHGGYGWMEESPIARFYRDAKVLEIGEGTSEVQKMVIARAIGATDSGRMREKVESVVLTERSSSANATV
ncbi:MAG: acyl-CoA dehydrogenase family protein [Actinobacteria bacterium]|nr:acyl-CoA dehydrogenase family protein [Actinomycetota bacterium]